MDEEQKQEQELITVNGGVEMEVAYQNNGSKEMVKVRQIPISRIQTFIMSMGNEAELIEVYCDRPKGWADTLTPESASAVADKGQELNIPFFAAWFRRQMKWRESQQLPGDTTSEGSRSSVTAAPSSPLANLPPQSPTTTS